MYIQSYTCIIKTFPTKGKNSKNNNLLIKNKELHKMNKTIKQTKKEDLYHYEGVGGKAVVVYLLKAHKDSSNTNDYANSLEREDTSKQYALGVYSGSEYKEMRQHAKNHARLTGEFVTEMETFLTL